MHTCTGCARGVHRVRGGWKRGSRKFDPRGTAVTYKRRKGCSVQGAARGWRRVESDRAHAAAAALGLRC